MAKSTDILNVLKGRGLSRRDRDVFARNIGEHVYFFSNLRQSWVYVNLSSRCWDCAFVEKVKLEESFVDLLLQRIVLRQPKLAMLKYHVASTNIHGCMVAQLHEQRRVIQESWKWLGDMGHWSMLSGRKGQDIVVVPYFDHSHWILFVLEDTKTYHFSVAIDVHGNMWADDYVTLLHVAWGTALGKNPGYADW
jgi:hypothetical protein